MPQFLPLLGGRVSFHCVLFFLAVGSGGLGHRKVVGPPPDPRPFLKVASGIGVGEALELTLVRVLS